LPEFCATNVALEDYLEKENCIPQSYVQNFIPHFNGPEFIDTSAESHYDYQIPFVIPPSYDISRLVIQQNDFSDDVQMSPSTG